MGMIHMFDVVSVISIFQPPIMVHFVPKEGDGSGMIQSNCIVIPQFVIAQFVISEQSHTRTNELESDSGCIMNLIDLFGSHI